MARSLLLIACVLGIFLNICVTGIQIGQSGNDLFEPSMLEISKEAPELISTLRDETIFHENGKTCSSDSDCSYESKCAENGSCSCPEGTNGTLCENVIECMEHPHMCGNGTDVKCVFNVKSKHAFCQCTEKKKWFNNFRERCAEPCEYHKQNQELVKKDCGLYGRCTNQFCWCVDGVSGDFCNKIDQCDKMDCGSDKTTTCTLGIDGPYCKCNKSYQVFDKTEKICKGEPCRKNSDCMYGGECTSDGTCSCPKGTDGPQCQDVIGCITNPKMCGKGTDVKCIFNVQVGQPDCQCTGKKKAFNRSRKRCAEPCEYYIKDDLIKEDCGKYGRCSNSFCRCVPGTSGDRCEIIDKCASKEVDCTNEPKAYCSLGINGAYCKCNVTYQVFDEKEKICKGEPCKKDSSNCMYDGNCTDDGTCNCIKGVGGPLCEQVYECEEKPDMCGNGTDVTCVFVPNRKRAMCMCEDEEKSYDLIEKKCKKDCKTDKDCGQFGRCDRKGFCRCLEGVSGDSCETIEKCVNVDCGETNCTLGGDGEARCICPDANQGFDYESKTCKACECGDNSKGCEFREGQKKCECALYYYRKGDKCEACNCGELSMGCELRDGKKECFCPLNYTTIEEKCQKCSCGTGSYHCRMKNGKADCVCYEPVYKQRMDKCEYCDCGVHGGKCSFTESGKKQCICEPGFKMLEETGFCTQVCNDTNKCQNGGMCVEDLCRCRENYAGAWCETPKWCLHNRCGHHFNQDDVDCIWDNVKKEGRCQCKDPLSFYRDDRTCDKCDCGPGGNCILTERGEKVCICNKGYADYLLKCQRCDCGSESTNCTFDYLGQRLCQCKEYYKQKESGEFATCARCDCGNDGICEFGGVSKTQKVCHCKENYKVFNGGCQECNCGPYGFCSFDSNGHKVCTCDYGYSVLNGRCESCDCEPPKIRGIGSTCIFKNSVKECHCPEGYESTKNEFCEDINECLKANACPKNTNCLNLPRSYSCQCKKGFKLPKLGLDPKQSGCEDIDECAEQPCTSNTLCVNMPGSYDCKCKEGYYPTSSNSGPYYNPHYATCNKEETQWRGASIALGVILSLGILGVGGYIFYLKKGFRFRR